jgi:sulfoxide reductase heme-binding subunit YedZ
MNEQIWWFVARSSGIVAWVFLTASVVWGTVLATDLFPRHRRPAWLLDLHRWLGGLTIGFLLVHLAGLMGDSYIDFGFTEFLVPMASTWKPVPVTLGVLAFWGLVIVQVTSLAMKRLPKRFWRAVHITSYATFWLTTLHGTYSGTDATKPMYVASSTVAITAVIFLVIYRILSVGQRGKSRRRSAAPVAESIAN